MIHGGAGAAAGNSIITTDITEQPFAKVLLPMLVLLFFFVFVVIE